MDGLEYLLSKSLAGMLPMPPPPFQTRSLQLGKRRVVVPATQNPMAPAFGQNLHSQSRDMHRAEDSAFSQEPFLKFAEKPQQTDIFTTETPFLSSSTLPLPLTLPAEIQESSEDSPFDLASYFRNPEKISTAHEALETLILGQNRPKLSQREEQLIKTLKQRREVVKELLLGALKAVRIGPTFSNAIVKSMPDFVDLVMIKAAALKKMPEHVHAPFSYRARLFIEQAAVGKKVRWLKHHKFTFSKIARLLMMVEDHEGILQPKVKWLKRVRVTGRDLAAVLTRDPIILEKSICEWSENVELLKCAGVRPDWIGFTIRRSSKILACNKEELQRQIDFYNRLGIEGDTFGKMIYHFPACLGHFSLDEMYSKLDYLRGFGLDDLALGQVLAEKPQLIACSIEEDWKPLVKLFYFLGIDGYGIRKILKVKPSVFCLNINNNIAPKIRFLRDVGILEEAIGDVLVKFPAILSYSLDGKIKPCVMFLLENAAVSITKVGKVLSLQPDLIGCSIKNRLDIAVRFFIYHGFKRQQVGLMVSDFPMLLRYSVSSMKPKLSFAFRVMKLQVEDVVKFPRLFSHSLELRIVPRYKILKRRGLNYSLRKMLACSDEEFMETLDEQEKDKSEETHEILDASTTTCKADLTDISSDLRVDEMAGLSWVNKSAELDLPESCWHVAFAERGEEGMREENLLESSRLDGPAELNISESSWQTISEAEEDVDEMFDEADMSDEGWANAVYTEGIHNVFYEDMMSDT